jgi:hypothetical protein
VPLVTVTDAGVGADASECVDAGDGGVLDAKTVASWHFRVEFAMVMDHLMMTRLM